MYSEQVDRGFSAAQLYLLDLLLLHSIPCYCMQNSNAFYWYVVDFTCLSESQHQSGKCCAFFLKSNNLKTWKWTTRKCRHFCCSRIILWTFHRPFSPIFLAWGIISGGVMQKDLLFGCWVCTYIFLLTCTIIVVHVFDPSCTRCCQILIWFV